MAVKYSVEISYTLEKELKINQIEVISRYMQIIKENTEIVEKDKVLNIIGEKYKTDMNSHDFDLQVSDLFTPGTVLRRNTNFHLNKLNIVNFIKEIPENYSILFVIKYVGKNLYRIYDIDDKIDYKTLSELDNDIINVVKKLFK